MHPVVVFTLWIPLVNVYITMQHHYFDRVNSVSMAIFNSYVINYQRVTLLQLQTPSETVSGIVVFSSVWTFSGVFGALGKGK